MDEWVSACVCVWEREREREWEWVSEWVGGWGVDGLLCITIPNIWLIRLLYNNAVVFGCIYRQWIYRHSYYTNISSHFQDTVQLKLDYTGCYIPECGPLSMLDVYQRCRQFFGHHYQDRIFSKDGDSDFDETSVGFFLIIIYLQHAPLHSVTLHA